MTTCIHDRVVFVSDIIVLFRLAIIGQGLARYSERYLVDVLAPCPLGRKLVDWGGGAANKLEKPGNENHQARGEAFGGW